MQKVIVVSLLALAACVVARPEGEAASTYTDRYDNINIKEILENHRLLLAYVQCLLGKGQCTAEGKELKEHIREALENNCAKCTQKQRDGTRQVIGHLINHEADFWTQLKAKYDPDNKFVTKYEDELRTVKA